MGQRELYAKGGIGRWYWDFRDRAVLRHTAKAQSVLDIGCGEGITLKKLRDQVRGRPVRGTDCDENSIKACRKRGLPADLGNAYCIPYHIRGGCDCCVMLDVVEHLSEPEKALAEARRALGRNGTLAIMFPNDRVFFWARLAFLKFRAAFADYGHVRRWTRKTMTAALDEAGFSVQSVQYLPANCLPSLSLHCLIVARRA